MSFLGLFEKKTRIFSRNDYAAYKAAKKALRAAGIRCYGGYCETELPVGGCGAKLDARNFGEKGKIERNVYYIDVPEQDAERARALPEIREDSFREA